MTPPLALVDPVMAAVIAPPFPGPIATAGVEVRLHAVIPIVSGKNLRPQFTSMSVWPTTSVIAGVISAHLDFAPHIPIPLTPPSTHPLSLTSLSIVPDRPRRIRRSGATFTGALVRAPQ